MRLNVNGKSSNCQVLFAAAGQSLHLCLISIRAAVFRCFMIKDVFSEGFFIFPIVAKR